MKKIPNFPASTRSLRFAAEAGLGEAGKFQNKFFGFLLIEVVIALALFILTLTIFGVAVSTVPLTKTAKHQNLAYHIAAKKIEELRNTPYSSLPPIGSSAFVDGGFADLPTASGLLVIAQYGVVLSDIRLVTVTVSWQEQGTARSVVLETLMAKSGLNQ